MTSTGGDQQTLRHWPTLLSFAGAALLCFGGLVPLARKFGTMNFAGQQEKVLLAGALLLGMVGLGGWAVAMLRTRLILDDAGVTMVSAFGRNRLDWSQVTGWEVESGPRKWLVRAWCGDRPYVVFRLMMPGVFVRSTITDETYPEPPATAPGSVHKTFDALITRWRASRTE